MGSGSMSGRVGSYDTQPFLSNDVDCFLLDLFSIFIHLRKSAREEDDLSDASCSAVPKGLRSLLRREYDYSQVYSFGKITDRSLDGQAQNFSALWVDQVDFS